MIHPPNLKSVVLPCCCGNCNHYRWNDTLHDYICTYYSYCTGYDEVCDTWDSIEYGN